MDDNEMTKRRLKLIADNADMRGPPARSDFKRMLSSMDVCDYYTAWTHAHTQATLWLAWADAIDEKIETFENGERG